MALPFLAAGAGALLGGIAGLFGSSSEQNSVAGVNVAPASSDELYGGTLQRNNLQGLEGLVNQGPGSQDVASGTAASRDLAALLQQYAQQGNLPTANDISNANSVAGNLFQAQRTAMEQAFADQQLAANQQAALMGRSANDPILRAKLAQEQTRQGALLNASQGAWAQQYALMQPEQRLGFAQQRAGILGGLASQAMANRQALASMGSQLQGSERNWRLQTAQRYGNTEQSSGGGVGGMISGALGGAGAGLSFAGGLQSLGMGGGAAGAGMGASPFSMPQNNFFSGLNPYSMAGPGLSAAPAAPTGFNMPAFGSQFNGAPRSFSLGG